jgi:SAM-dependent methyltransferase
VPPDGSDNPWLGGDGPRGEHYDRRFETLAASGHDVHGEADLIASLDPTSVLDAGCGTGRVAIELARRGIDVVGVDLDPSMLSAARRKAPSLHWVEADLATVRLDRTFDVTVMAGNVLLFVAPATEHLVLATATQHLSPGGSLVTGFSLRPGGFDLRTFDALARDVGLTLAERWGTWERGPFLEGGDYVVSRHVRSPG